METLKLDHELALSVINGSKTATWRIYDDKDTSVDDTVQLIDKANPKDPSSWKAIGTAHIDVVVEKRISDISEADCRRAPKFISTEEILREFQKHYGPQVSVDTPVKIIHFTFSSLDSEDFIHAQIKPREAKLYADGGSRGNPGPSASGYVITTMDGEVIAQNGTYLGITTNNQAEYQALKVVLEEARSLGIRHAHVFMDSLLVINQMKSVFKVKNRDLWPIHDAIKNMLPNFDSVSFTHIPRELNKLADSAVNDALDAAERSQML